MRRLTRETCDQLVNIPMLGSVESLNVSVASAVCLYETVRQRQPDFSQSSRSFRSIHAAGAASPAGFRAMRGGPVSVHQN